MKNWVLFLFIPADEGDIVRIQPNHISFRCIEAVPDIHGSKTGVRKGDFYSYVLRQPPTPPNLLSETYIP